MKKIRLIIFIFYFLSGFANAQSISYEQNAFNFFADSIVPKELHKVKIFKINPILDTTTTGYSNCRIVKNPYIAEIVKPVSINYQNQQKFKTKLSLFENIFLNHSSKKQIHIFKRRTDAETITVNIAAFGQDFDYYFSIELDEISGKILNYCKTTMYE